MNVFQFFRSLWGRFTGKGKPAGNAPATEAGETTSSYPPGDTQLRAALLEQLPEQLPQKGHLLARMQVGRLKNGGWETMDGVLLCDTIPSEDEVEAITGEVAKVIEGRHRVVIAQQKVRVPGTVLLVEMIYADKIPMGRPGIEM